MSGGTKSLSCWRADNIMALQRINVRDTLPKSWLVASLSSNPLLLASDHLNHLTSAKKYIKNVHCYIGMVYMLFFDKHSQLVLEVRLYIFAVYKYKLKYKSVHSTTASEYVTHTWSIRPPCHFYSSSSPHLLNIYVGHRAAAVLLNIY